MTTTALINAGALISGELDTPLLDHDAILFDDGMIAAIGSSADVRADAQIVVDLAGAAVSPGLFDTHLHPSLNDFTERQEASGFIARSVAGGVTSFISAGECHVPARPRDATGSKALAILAHSVFERFHPNAAKVHAGSVFLARGMTQEDFAEMAAAGVWLVGEIGLSDVHEPEEAAPMVRWAHEAGFKVIMHTGGASIPGSNTIGLRHVREIGPDVAAHLNGGPTSLSHDEIEAVIRSTDVALEIITNGNPRSALFLLETAVDAGAEHRLILGNDMPSGVGVTPLGILRTAVYLASVGGVPPERALAYASGNAGRVFGREEGVLAVGRPADAVVLDAPKGGVGGDALASMRCGDHPSIRAVFVDGTLVVGESPITPDGEHAVVVSGLS